MSEMSTSFSPRRGRGSRFLRLIAAGMLSLALFSGVQTAPAVAAAPSAVGTGQGPTMAKVISDSKKKNKKAFAARLAKLKKSKALVSIVKDVAPKRYTLYMEFFAAASTMKMVDTLLKKTKGKFFTVSGTPSAPKVKLVKGTNGGRLLTPGINCVEGWAAVAAWEFGVGLLCWGAAAAAAGASLPSIVGVIPAAAATAVICQAFFIWLSNQFIDFNAACYKKTDPI